MLLLVCTYCCNSERLWELVGTVAGYR